MKKILKRVTAMCCATVMAMSMMVNASAANDLTIDEAIGSYKLPNKISGSGKVTSSGSVGGFYANNITVKASTGLSTYSGGATVSICIYYTKSNGATGHTGNGSSGQSGASTSKTINKKAGVYRYSINNHSGYGKNTRTVKLYKK